MGTMTQQPPSRTRTTIIKENLPSDDRGPSDAKPSPFYDRDWEIVVQALTKEDWLGHKMRVYRAGEKWERGSAPIDNIFKAPFTEDDLRARFGGGKYVLWLYGPPKEQNLVGKYQVELDGAPIINSVPRNGVAGDGSNSVALEAMRLYANPEFVRMQMQMMQTAAMQAMELIKSQIPQAQDPLATLRNAKEILGIGAPAPNPMNDLMQSFMTAAIQKLLNPPESNSLQSTIKLINDVKAAGLLGGAPKADLAATFANNLPMLVDRLVNGLHEFRLNSEAQERTVRLQRGEIRASDPNVIDVAPSPAATVAPAVSGANPSPAPANSAGAVSPEVAQGIIVQSHLHRLVAGINDPESDGQDMYDYLRNAWPEILDALTKFSAEQLLGLFKNRDAQIQYFGVDILTQVADNPRLPKIIEDFLRIAKEAEAAEKSAGSEKTSVASGGVV
jgi:hypothetical protein